MDEAEARHRRSAGKGSTYAMSALAYILCERGETREAEIWYRRAAETGGSDGMLRLAGFLCEQGETQEAESLYRRAASTGSIHAVIGLAEFLRKQGAIEDAVVLYRQAANSGSGPGMLQLAGFLVEQGETQEAASWYGRAADTGSIQAMARLAEIRHEQGATEDSVALLIRAAETGKSSVAEEFSRSASEWVDALLTQGRFHEVDAVLAAMERVDEHDASRRRPYGLPVLGGIESTAWIVITTAAIVPFLQTIMTKAGEDGYRAVRSVLQRLSSRGRRQPTDSDGGVSNVLLHVPSNVPDDALQRLISMDLVTLSQAGNALTIEVSWDDVKQEWKVTMTAPGQH